MHNVSASESEGSTFKGGQKMGWRPRTYPAGHGPCWTGSVPARVYVPCCQPPHLGSVRRPGVLLWPSTDDDTLSKIAFWTSLRAVWRHSTLQMMRLSPGLARNANDRRRIKDLLTLQRCRPLSMKPVDVIFLFLLPHFYVHESHNCEPCQMQLKILQRCFSLPD
jgi:hypothetical protein